MIAALKATSRSFRILLLVGLAVRLVLMLTTLVSNDNAVYGAVLDAARAHRPLYADSTFSYPPLLGYYFEGVGRLLQLLGQPTFVRAEALLMFVVPDLTTADLTTPLATFLIKLPALVLDAACCLEIARMARRLDLPAKTAEMLVLFWWLNPEALWSGGIAGAWDAIVPLVALATVGAMLDGRWYVAGSYVAFGAFAKIVPVYLLVLALPASLAALPNLRAAVRRAALFAGGFATVGALALWPILAWHEIPELRHAIFTRFGDFSPTGLTVLSFLSLNPFANALRWTQEHRAAFVAGYATLGLLAPLAVGAALLGQSLRPRTYLVAAAALLTSLLVFSPFVQGNYVIWLVPLVVLLYRADRAYWPWLATALGAVAAVFAHVVRGTAGIVYPACVWYRLCDPREFGSQAMAYHFFPGALSGSRQVEWNAILGVVGGAVIVCVAVLLALEILAFRRARGVSLERPT